MKILLLLLLLIPLTVEAETICPESKQEGYHPIPEIEFTVARANDYIASINRYFEGKEIIEYELILTAQIMIEGAFLRSEVLLAKEDPIRLKATTENFCNFLVSKAYYVH
jgi:hypothetical protein